MHIELTKDQYKALMKLVYVGLHVMYENVAEKEEKDYENLESYLWSYAKEFGLHDYVTRQENRDIPGRKIENEMVPVINEYDNEVFWYELSDRLAETELLREYSEDALSAMSEDEFLSLKAPLIDKYDREFEEHGLDNLVLRA